MKKHILQLMHRFWGSILLVFCMSQLLGQGAASQNFTIANGLPSNRVYHSLVDTDGFIWFSTDKGVSRYDGYAFRNFTTRDGLTDNEVFYMFEDSKHRIWFMTYSGKLSYYKEGRFYNPGNTPFLNQAITQDMFSRTYEDKWGNILFITTASGCYVLKDTTFTHHFSGKSFYSPYTVNGQLYFSCLASDTAVLITVKPNGTLKTLDSTFGTQFLFYTWSEKGKLYNMSSSEDMRDQWQFFVRKKDKYSYRKIIIKNREKASPFYVKRINGSVYLGTNKGLYTINLKQKKLNPVGFYANQISSVAFDFEGNMWVTTLQNGVFLRPKINLSKYKNISGNINEIEVNPFNNEVWAGNPRKVLRITSQDKREYQLPSTKAYNEKITSFHFISEQRLLVGSDLCLAYFDGKEFRRLSDGYSGVKNISYNPYTKKAVGAFAAGLASIELGKKTYQLPQKIISGRSTSVLAIDTNILLVGSNSGLFRLNTSTGKKKLVLDSRINHIKKDKKGNIWCSSDVAGLYLYKNGKFTQFTEKEGLHTNNINKLTLDNAQNIWLTSPKGVIKAKYNNGELEIQNYILSNILGREQVNDVAIIRDTVLVATTAGLYYFKEKQLRQQPIKPPLVINSVVIEGKQQKISNTYSLSHEQNNIHIDFTGISYSTQNINYRYKLSSNKNEWQYTTTRSINLVDLNPGKYTLTLQVIKDGTIFSDVKQIRFTIVPPFYAAWWFYLVVFIVLALIVSALINLRITSIRKKAYVSQIIAESKQKALRAQMNPHFLFNSLISIQSFFLNKRNTEGQEYTSKFSKLIRNILDNSDKEYITIEEEISTLKHYTDLENIRLKTPFVFNITISDDIDESNTHLPTMLLQPIIENAIWHGINYLENEQGKIEVAFTKKGSSLIITIKDNGVGFSKSAEINKKRNHISKGTKLIKERLEAINIKRKNTVSYTAKDSPEGGAIVTLVIPIEE